MLKIISSINKKLAKYKSEKHKKGASLYFKEKVIFLGVKVPIVRQIMREEWKKIKNLPKQDRLCLAEEFLSSKYFEHGVIGIEIIWRSRGEFEKKDISFFENIINRHIRNWAHCDDFCNHVIGFMLEKYPELAEQVMSWSKSKNMRVRRASAVSFILPARRGNFLKNIFIISDILLKDSEDLVQKGYGWALKEASRMHKKEVFDFLCKRKNKMPRTALRYGLEKYTPAERAFAMK
jgi:3-methyladenine DNA glycosylase AlkD